MLFRIYIVRETKVPANYYQETGAEWKITIDDDSPLITLDIANLRQYGSVRVVKTAEDGLVEGLTFSLTGTSVYGEPVSMTELPMLQELQFLREFRLALVMSFQKKIYRIGM